MFVVSFATRARGQITENDVHHTALRKTWTYTIFENSSTIASYPYVLSCFSEISRRDRRQKVLFTSTKITAPRLRLGPEAYYMDPLARQPHPGRDTLTLLVRASTYPLPKRLRMILHGVGTYLAQSHATKSLVSTGAFLAPI